MKVHRIIFVLAIVIFSLVATFINFNFVIGDNKKLHTLPPLRVSNRYISTELNYYDPALNRAMHQMVITEAIYSRLLEKDQDGVVKGSLAESFDIVNSNEIVLKIRSGLKTVDGRTIDNRDVVFSLKRLVTVPNGFSGNFKELIRNCEISSPLDDCEGLRILSDNRVVIRSSIYPDLLLESFVDAPYSIVPISSFSEDRAKIVDFRNTSGPYYFDSFSESGHMVVKANPNHYSYHEKMPQVLIFVGENDKDAGNQRDVYQEFSDAKIDHIPTSEWMASSSSYTDLIDESEEKNYDVHVTYGLVVTTAKFTQKGRELPLDTRLALGKKLRKLFAEMNPAVSV